MRNEVFELREGLIKRASLRRGPDWMAGLSARKIRELEFHNLDRASPRSISPDEEDQKYANRKYYATTGRSRDYVLQWLKKKVPGKVFLDYACGNGDQVILAARFGAALAIGIDLSDVSLENATRSAAEAGVPDRCVFIQGDCEKTGLPDECVDVVLCCGMLHHLDLSYAFPELRRILKSGGRVLCIEALGYNPIINLYRRWTPSMRTEWETSHILCLEDLKFARRFFDVGEVRYWHLFVILGAFFSKNERMFSSVLAILEKVDSVLLRIPGVGLMSWQFTFELFKRCED